VLKLTLYFLENVRIGNKGLETGSGSCGETVQVTEL